MTTIVVRNTTTSDLTVDTLGFTIEALGTHDVSLIDRQARSESSEFMGLVASGQLLVIKDSDPETYWDDDEARLLLTVGVNKTMVNLDKVDNTLHNFEAFNPPSPNDDVTLGYSKGSIWIATTATTGFRAFVCASAAEGAAIWGELTQPPVHPGVIEQRYYGPTTDDPLVSDPMPANRLNAVPVAYPTATQWNRIGVNVTEAVPGGVVRLGIFANDHGRPGALLLDAGYVTIDTTGNKEIVIDWQNSADWFWLGAVASQTASYMSLDTMAGGAHTFGVADPTSGGGAPKGFRTDYPYGVLPAAYPHATSDWSNHPPFIWLRRV